MLVDKKQELRAKGKGLELAGKVKGDGGRFGERAACEELCEVEGKSGDADIAVGDDMVRMSQGGLSLGDSASKQAMGEREANCEGSFDWRFQPLSIPGSSKRDFS